MEKEVQTYKKSDGGGWTTVNNIFSKIIEFSLKASQTILSSPLALSLLIDYFLIGIRVEAVQDLNDWMVVDLKMFCAQHEPEKKLQIWSLDMYIQITC